MLARTVMAVSAKQAMANVFAPFVAAAGNPSYASRLKTADIEGGRKTAQFKKLRNLKLAADDPLHFPSNAFLCRFSDSENNYICISVQHLDAEGGDLLLEWASEEGYVEDVLDESTFLFMCSQLSNYYRPLGRNLKKERAENILNLFGPDGNAEYVGHQIGGAIEWYQAVVIFSVPKDHRSLSERSYSIAASLSAYHPEYRSAILPNFLSVSLSKISKLENVNPENVYYALTSSHWKQIFMDVYKCLEAIFYLPWTTSLRIAISHPKNSLSLAKQCKASLHWREQEKTSIEALFGMLPEAIYKPPMLSGLSVFNDLYNSDDAKPSSYGRRVYTIRNYLVHQEDYEEKLPVNISNEMWPHIVDYVCSIVHEIYSTNSADIDYDYSLEVALA